GAGCCIARRAQRGRSSGRSDRRAWRDAPPLLSAPVSLRQPAQGIHWALAGGTPLRDHTRLRHQGSFHPLRQPTPNTNPERGALHWSVGDRAKAFRARRATMKTPILVLAFSIALSAALPVRAEILQGDRFVTAMKDNTVSGQTPTGAAYN